MAGYGKKGGRYVHIGELDSEMMVDVVRRAKVVDIFGNDTNKLVEITIAENSNLARQ